MKKLFPLIFLLIALVSSTQTAHATHFSCTSIKPGANSLTLEVQSAKVVTEYVKVINVTDPNNTYAKSQSGQPTYQGDKATYIFEDLSPGATYKAQVYSSNGTFIEDIAQCRAQIPGGVAAGGNGNAGDGSGNQRFVPNVSGQAGGGFLLDVKLQNPLKVNTIGEAVRFFVNTLIRIAIPFIVVFFIWAGLKFILARGKPDKITEAKKMFWYTIIGTLLILGAWTITNAIIGTVNSITK